MANDAALYDRLLDMTGSPSRSRQTSKLVPPISTTINLSGDLVVAA